jgi:flagellin-like protein
MGYMKANKKYILEEDEGVSAVIGVILMVAITVAIAATVYVYVSGMIGGSGGQTPTISLSAERNRSAGHALISINSISDPSINWGDVNIVLVNMTTGEPFGNPTPPTNNPIQGGQTFTVEPLTNESQYRVTLVYSVTGGTMGAVSWTQ